MKNETQNAGYHLFRAMVLLFCHLLTLLMCTNAFCQTEDHILVLHSYNKGLTWTDSEDTGIEPVLRTRGLKTTDAYLSLRTDQGRLAAEMSLRILDGEKVRDIPVIRQSPNKYKSDYLQMSRFGITPADLPPGSMVINKPVFFYESHKWLVWGGLAGFAGFTLIIILLLGYIRQHLRTEERLVESENRFRSLSNDALVGIYIIQDAFFRYVNPKMAEIFGFEVEELVDKIPPRLLVVAEDWPTVRDNLQKRLTDEQRSIHYEFRGLRKDKQIVFVEVFGSRTVIQGKPAVIGTLLDITERKKMEQMKDEMISAVSHEMRTPLTAMMGYTELMLDNEVLTDRQKEYLQIIQRESERLNELIGNFLDLQRYKSRGEPLSFQPLSIQPLLENTAATVGATSQRHHIALDCPADLPRVRGNEEHLRQVFKNLVSNAVKYSPKGGEVEIAAHREDDCIIIMVRDEGIGIPPEALEKVFESFYRVNNTARRAFGGTGLGLTLVRDIVTAHRGKVWVESTLGKGSRFFVSLPVA